jgi:hypothetical protein
MSLANAISADTHKKERRQIAHSEDESNDRSAPSEDVLDRKPGRICCERLAAGKFFARQF